MTVETTIQRMFDSHLNRIMKAQLDEIEKNSIQGLPSLTN